MIISMVDLETSDLDPGKGEIIEVGLIVFEDKEPFTILHTLNLKVKPEHPETGSLRAYEVNGYSEKEWKGAATLDDALTEIGEIPEVRGSTFASYNVSFDWGFMQEAYRTQRREPPFHHLRLDVFTLAWSRLKLPRWGLKNVCERLGIPPEPDVHRALNGAKAAYDVYVQLMGPRFIVSEQTLLPL